MPVLRGGVGLGLRSLRGLRGLAWQFDAVRGWGGAVLTRHMVVRQWILHPGSVARPTGAAEQPSTVRKTDGKASVQVFDVLQIYRLSEPRLFISNGSAVNATAWIV